MNRYDDVTQEENDLLREIRAEYCPELRNANIKMLFDLKKRQYDGKIVLGRIQKANDLVKYFTQNEEDEAGVDYIIFLDKICWDAIQRSDKIKLLRHELRHAFFDADSEKTPYKLLPHDIEDFAEEVHLNQDDVSWRLRVAELTAAIYDQKADEGE